MLIPGGRTTVYVLFALASLVITSLLLLPPPHGPHKSTSLAQAPSNSAAVQDKPAQLTAASSDEESSLHPALDSKPISRSLPLASKNIDGPPKRDASLASRAREVAQEHDLERERILKELKGKTLEEVVVDAESVWPSTAFVQPGAGAAPWKATGVQNQLLQDPRLATLLLTALHGTDEERQKIVDSIPATIAPRLEERRKMFNGDAHDLSMVSLGPGAGVYPLALVEADVAGSSLPLLLQWYDSERGNVATSEDVLRLYATLGESPETAQSAGLPLTSTMLLIAGAVSEISNRLGEPLYEPDDDTASSLNRTHTFQGGVSGATAVGDLAGYALFRDLTGPECDAIMDRLRARLGEETDTREN